MGLNPAHLGVPSTRLMVSPVGADWNGCPQRQPPHLPLAWKRKTRLKGAGQRTLIPHISDPARMSIRK